MEANLDREQATFFGAVVYRPFPLLYAIYNRVS